MAEHPDGVDVGVALARQRNSTSERNCPLNISVEEEEQSPRVSRNTLLHSPHVHTDSTAQTLKGGKPFSYATACPGLASQL
jgi:hypothetical protein